MDLNKEELFVVWTALQQLVDNTDEEDGEERDNKNSALAQNVIKRIETVLIPAMEGRHAL